VAVGMSTIIRFICGIYKSPLRVYV